MKKQIKKYERWKRKRKGKMPKVEPFAGVFSNMKSLKFADGYIESLEQLNSIVNGVVLLDEGHVWFFSRNWKNIPKDLIFFWTQVRKRGLDIIYTAQNLSFVDVDIRRITDNIIRVSKFGPFVFKRVRDEIDQDRMKYRLGGFSYVKSAWKYYDTKEIIFSPIEAYGSRDARDEFVSIINNNIERLYSEYKGN